MTWQFSEFTKLVEFLAPEHSSLRVLLRWLLLKEQEARSSVDDPSSLLYFRRRNPFGLHSGGKHLSSLSRFNLGIIFIYQSNWGWVIFSIFIFDCSISSCLSGIPTRKWIWICMLGELHIIRKPHRFFDFEFQVFLSTLNSTIICIRTSLGELCLIISLIGYGGRAGTWHSIDWFCFFFW